MTSTAQQCELDSETANMELIWRRAHHKWNSYNLVVVLQQCGQGECSRSGNAVMGSDSPWTWVCGEEQYCNRS